MAKVVILGAGLTGLSAAYHFEKKRFYDIKIFEKESVCGGLCRSIKHDGFTFDFTGHLIHCKDTYSKNLIEKILPSETRNKIGRNSFVFTHNKFVPYPFQMNLLGLPDQIIAECICGFAKRKHQIKNPENFYQWALKYFGAGIAKHFLFPYNDKILKFNLKKIHPSWTGNFVPKTTIKDLFEGLRDSKTKDTVGYNHHFYYPKKGGIQFFIDNFRKQIKSKVDKNYVAKKINFREKTVIFENGHKENFEILITTIPLNNFLKMSIEPSNLNLKKVHSKLFCNSVINFNVGFKPENFSDKHWIYIPEKKYDFYRIGFWNNFSQNMAPKNCSSFYGELSYLKRDNKKLEIKNLRTQTEKSIDQICDFLKIKKSSIVTQKILHLPNAYVIYDLWREKNLNKIHRTLNQNSIYSVGRYGEWKYSSMQDAIIDGKNVVETILKLKETKKFIPAIKQIDYVIPKEKEKIKQI